MEIGQYERLSKDVEVNRKICMHLMGRLAEAMQHMGRLPQIMAVGEANDPPPWVRAFFDSKEGLSSAYIKLSQQHLKLAALQMELLKEKQQATPPLDERQLSLNHEEMRFVRAYLEQMEEGED